MFLFSTAAVVSHFKSENQFCTLGEEPPLTLNDRQQMKLKREIPWVSRKITGSTTLRFERSKVQSRSSPFMPDGFWFPNDAEIWILTFYRR